MYDYVEDDIKEILVKIGISSGDTVYCHSNIGLFGRIKNFTDKEGVCSKFYSSIFDIISRFPTRADNGYPFAMALPNAARSGVTL